MAVAANVHDFLPDRLEVLDRWEGGHLLGEVTEILYLAEKAELLAALGQ